MCPFYKVICLSIINFSIITSLNAMTIKEQEANITKAQDNYENENYYKTEKVLLENVEKGKYYLPTYNLLSDLYIMQEQYSKSLKLLYYIIKQEHTDKILKFTYEKDIEVVLKNMKRPSDDILTLYKNIASNYLNIYQSGKFKTKFNKKLLKRALKYFNVINYYDFDKFNTYFNIATLHYNAEEFHQSIKWLQLTLKLYKNNKMKDQDSLDQIYYYTGASYLQIGRSDLAELYLNKIYNNTKSNKNMKTYANEYLDYIKENYINFNISMGADYSTNIHGLNELELSTFSTDYASTYGSEKATLKNISISGSLSQKLSNTKVLGVTANYSQSSSLNKNVRIADSKEVSATTNVYFHRSKYFLYNVGYSYSLSFARESKDVSLTKYSNNHSFSFNFTHLFMSGVLNYSLPITIANYFTSNVSTKSYGLNLNYTPYTNSKYINPILGLSTSLNEETSVATKSTLININLSNTLNLSDRLSADIGLNFNKNLNSSSEYDYLEFFPSLGINYSFKTLSFLSINIFVNKSIKTYSDSNKTKNTNLGSTFNFGF